MRALPLACAVVCLAPAICSAAPLQREPSDELQIEAAQDRGIEGIERGPSHQHWLYDEQNQPETNALARREEGCSEYRVRTPRAGGGSDIKRMEKCD